MLIIMYFILLIILIMIILITLNIFLSIFNNSYNREKNYPFECGFNNKSNNRLPFSTHYFLITLLFMIFDIEIMFIIPSLFLMKSFNSIYLSLLLLFFLMILIISLIYEWIYGLLNWII